MRRASAALSTIGTMTPYAPTSSARAMKWYSLRGTRTSGSMPMPRQPAASIFRVSNPRPACSMSNNANSQPAAFRTCGMPGAKNSNTIAPATGSPASTRCRMALGRTPAVLPATSPIGFPPFETPAIIARRPR